MSSSKDQFMDIQARQSNYEAQGYYRQKKTNQRLEHEIADAYASIARLETELKKMAAMVAKLKTAKK